jgi:hypothetical protein
MKCDARTGRAGVSPLPCGRCPTCCHPYRTQRNATPFVLISECEEERSRGSEEKEWRGRRQHRTDRRSAPCRVAVQSNPSTSVECEWLGP